MQPFINNYIRGPFITILSTNHPIYEWEIHPVVC